MKSKLISLCAISSSFVAICLTIGAYIETIDIFMLIVASIFVILPLYYNSFKGCLLAFLVGGVIAVILSGFNMAVIFPAYFSFFGLYPIFKHKVLQKGVNKVVSAIIGLIWILIAFYGCYYYYIMVLGGEITGVPEQIKDYIVYLVGLLAIIFYIVFDKSVVIMKFTIDKYLKRIIK